MSVKKTFTPAQIKAAIVAHYGLDKEFEKIDGPFQFGNDLEFHCEEKDYNNLDNILCFEDFMKSEIGKKLEAAIGEYNVSCFYNSEQITDKNWHDLFFEDTKYILLYNHNDDYKNTMMEIPQSAADFLKAKIRISKDSELELEYTLVDFKKV